MESYLRKFNDLASDRLAMQQADWSLAHAGVANGRNTAQLAALGSDALPINKREKDGASDTLDIILSTISYDELLSRTYARLGEAETAVDALISLAAERFEAEQARLDDLETQAAQLPDGTLVARAEDEHVYAIESGRRISDEEAATILWRGDEPDLETIRAQQERTDAAFDVLDRARDHELELGHLREELSEQPSRERLHELEDEIEVIQSTAERDIASLSVQEDRSLDAQIDVTPVVLPSL